MVPGRLQGLPRPLQEPPKTPQDGPKTSPRGSETLPRCPKFHSRCSQDLSKTPKTPPRAPKKPPSCPKSLPRCSQDPPLLDFWSSWEGLGEIFLFQALATCRQYETKINSKFEFKAPISTCQSLVLHGCPPRMTAASAKRSQFCAKTCESYESPALPKSGHS